MFPGGRHGIVSAETVKEKDAEWIAKLAVHHHERLIGTGAF